MVMAARPASRGPWAVSVVTAASWRCCVFGWSHQPIFWEEIETKVEILEHFPTENSQKQPGKAALLILYSLSEAMKCDLRKVGVVTGVLLLAALVA